jgi:hypothetical protein
LNYVIFDIETGPLPLPLLKEILPGWDASTMPHPGEFDPRSVKTGNIKKDQAKIDAKIQEARESHQERVNNHGLDALRAEQNYWAEASSKAALSAATGRVVAIGCKSHTKVSIAAIGDDKTEWQIISEFWQLYEQLRKNDRNLVGFNSSEFDIPFLAQRSVVLDIPVPRTLIKQGRYLDEMFIDLRKVWSFGARPTGSLDMVCRACGIPGKPEGVNGAMFAELYFNEETRDEAIAYLENDLEMTFALA